jgi:hypothetical protein
MDDPIIRLRLRFSGDDANSETNLRQHGAHIEITRSKFNDSGTASSSPSPHKPVAACCSARTCSKVLPGVG